MDHDEHQAHLMVKSGEDEFRYSRSTKQPPINQVYAGSGALPPFHDFVSFCVTRVEVLRRLLTAVPVENDSFDVFRFRVFRFVSSEWMESIVDCTLAGISCI